MCECKEGYMCGYHSRQFFKDLEEEENADTTVYKFTLEVKGEVAYANTKHGSFGVYQSYTVTRTCTNSVLNKEILEFQSSGGKVISTYNEIAKAKCVYCLSELTYSELNPKTQLCKSCETKLSKEEPHDNTEKLITKILNYKPKFNHYKS